MGSILCRPQGEPAQQYFESEARRYVAQQGIVRLPAEIDRRHDLIDRPALGLTRELGGVTGVDQERGRRAAPGQQEIAAEKPVGVHQRLRLLAVDTIETTEERLEALRLRLGQDLASLGPRLGRAGVVPPGEAAHAPPR